MPWTVLYHLKTIKLQGMGGIFSSKPSTSASESCKILSGKEFTSVNFHKYIDWNVCICSARMSTAQSSGLKFFGAKHCAVYIEVEHSDKAIDPKNRVFSFWLEGHKDGQKKQMAVSTSNSCPFKDQGTKITQFYIGDNERYKRPKVRTILNHLEDYIRNNPFYDVIKNNCFDIVAEVFVACNQIGCANSVRGFKQAEVNNTLSLKNLLSLPSMRAQRQQKQYNKHQIQRMRREGYIVGDNGLIISAPSI